MVREYPADEITRDPIFLFQSRRWQFMDVPDGWEMVDGEWMRHEDGSELDITWENCQEFEESFDYWDTEYVFFTRAEAEAWGQRANRRYPDGWRVYCVCAKGELAQLLDAQTITP